MISTQTYRAADQREHTGPALLVRAKYATTVHRSIGGVLQFVQVPAGAQLWSPLTNHRIGMPSDPHELFGVIVDYCGRRAYMSAGASHFAPVEISERLSEGVLA